MGNKESLLVVDDEVSVTRALRRVLAPYFAALRLANTPYDARVILASEKITHVLCDHWLGVGEPLGLDLLPRWKSSFPSIERAVLFTGFDVEALAPDPKIDAVISKRVDLDALVCTLFGDNRVA